MEEHRSARHRRELGVQQRVGPGFAEMQTQLEVAAVKRD